MNKNSSRTKLGIFMLALVLCTAALYLLVKNNAITLGLDLQGGTFLLLEVDAKDGGSVTKELIGTTVAVIRERVDGSGTREAEITREGGKRIRVSIPGAKDTEEVFNLIHQEGLLEVIDIIPTVPLEEIKGLDDCTIGDTILSGDFVENVNFGYRKEMPAAIIKYTKEASKVFCDHLNTIRSDRGTMDRGIMYTLDGELLYYGFMRIPHDTPPITPDRCGEAILRNRDANIIKHAVKIIKSGIMPASLSAVEERTIGPSLGKESLQKSLVAGIVGILLVLLFMGIVYRRFGLMADIALITYFILVMYLLIMFKVTFTLSGVAGLILGIGMAVDANIIIFERIREELRAGLPMMESLEIGFRQAKETIIDSNTTTLLVAAILFLFGSGIVRGFAMTLSFSILVSMFSALNITRWLLTCAIDGGIILGDKAIGIGGSH